MRLPLPILAATCFVLLASTLGNAQWERSNGPIAGVAATGFGISGPYRFLGTQNCGVFYSQSYNNWIVGNDSLDDLRIVKLIDFTPVYARPNNGIIIVSTATGNVYRLSTDAGHWHWVKMAVPDSSGTLLLTGISGTLYVSKADSALYRSTDVGKTWTILPVPGRVYSLVGSGSFLAAGSDAGVFRSTDVGASWTLCDSTMVGGNAASALVMRKGYLYAGATHGTFVSSDSARTWTVLDASFAGHPVTCLAASDTYLYAAADSSLYRFDETSGSWQPLPMSGTLPSGIHVAALNTWNLLESTGGPMSGLAVCAAEGYAEWQNFSSWVAGGPIPPAMAGTTVFTAPTRAGGTQVFSQLIGQDLYRSSDNGDHWMRADSGLPVGSPACGAIGLFDGDLYMAVGGCAIFQSTDDGTHWTACDSGLTATQIVGLTAAQGFLIAGTDSGLFRLSDPRGPWTRADTGIGTKHVSAMANVHGHILTVTPAGICRSADAGTTWSVVPPPSRGIVWSLFASDSAAILSWYFNDGDNVWIDLFRSTDDGVTWTDCSPVRWNLNFVVANYGKTIISESDGHYTVSTDAGLSWKPDIIFASGLPEVDLFALTSDHVFATHSYQYRSAGYFGWVWRRPLTEIVATVASARTTTEAFLLFQNYPNPFNPSTTIRYSLPHRSHVTLAVFNTLGQKVTELVNREVDAGYHEVQFDAGRLASGVYFYRLQAGSFVTTKRLCILR